MIKCLFLMSVKLNVRLLKLKEWIDANDTGAIMIPFSGAFEGKIFEMDKDARTAYLEENKCTSALEKIIIQGYKSLQLMYYFTGGHDEVKAWTIQVSCPKKWSIIIKYWLFILCSIINHINHFIFQKGTKAPQAAGRIHTDFEKGFIMAEVMKFADLKEEGTEATVKVSFPFLFQNKLFKYFLFIETISV